MLLLVKIFFLVSSLCVECKNDDRKIKRFEDIRSEEIIDNFDYFPLHRRDVRPSGWCEYWPHLTYQIKLMPGPGYSCPLQGVDSLEEVREVGEELYSKVSLVDRTLVQPITNIHSGQTTHLVLRPVLNCFKQSDEQLVSMVKHLMIESDPQTQYNLSKPLEELLEQQKNDPFDLSLEMDNEIFRGEVKDGFFIEAGAFEGDEDSHSLLFESKYNWTGLLVEPIQIDVLKSKNRKSTLVPFCLSIEAKPQYVEFDIISAFEIDSERNKRSMRGIVQDKTEDSSTVQCLPLYTMLLARGNPTVHWFILDIEGAEYQVLQTIPWDLVDIEMVSVETDLAGLIMPGSRQEIIDYMKTKGYIHRCEVLISFLRHSSFRRHRVNSHFKSGAVKDDLFIREDVFTRYRHLSADSRLLKDEL